MSDEGSGRKRRRLVAEAGAGETCTTIVTPGAYLGGRYHLIREIGRGGMGVVFEATDDKLEGHEVAVKVLPPELARSRRAVDRLRKEALACLRLSHPHVLRLHAFDEDGETAFLVMELVRGQDLDDALADEGSLSPERVLPLARQVADALDYAHGLGVVHRDIKPANILVDTSGPEPSARLADFGIAFVARDSLTRLTGVEAAGTLHYVAPEIFRGDRPDARSDQYALAATLYELLAGDPPFTGPGLSQQILDAPPPRLPDVPPHLADALVRGLAKDPADRFPSCAVMVRAMAGDPVAAIMTSNASPSEVPTRVLPREGAPRPAWFRAALAACACAVLVVGLLALARSWTETPPAASPSATPLLPSSSPSPSPTPPPTPPASPSPLPTPETTPEPPPTFNPYSKEAVMGLVAPPAPALVQRGTTVVITSVPDGAKVFCLELPDRYLGKTSDGLSRTFPPGTYNLKFQLDGYEDKFVEVVSKPERLSADVEAVMVALPPPPTPPTPPQAASPPPPSPATRVVEPLKPLPPPPPPVRPPFTKDDLVVRRLFENKLSVMAPASWGFTPNQLGGTFAPGPGPVLVQIFVVDGPQPWDLAEFMRTVMRETIRVDYDPGEHARTIAEANGRMAAIERAWRYDGVDLRGRLGFLVARTKAVAIICQCEAGDWPRYAEPYEQLLRACGEVTIPTLRDWIREVGQPVKAQVFTTLRVQRVRMHSTTSANGLVNIDGMVIDGIRYRPQRYRGAADDQERYGTVATLAPGPHKVELAGKAAWGIRVRNFRRAGEFVVRPGQAQYEVDLGLLSP